MACGYPNLWDLINMVIQEFPENMGFAFEVVSLYVYSVFRSFWNLLKQNIQIFFLGSSFGMV